MARGDIKIRTQLAKAFSQKWNVPSGTVKSINAGEPTKTVDAAAASPYLGTTAIMVDGDGTTSQRFTGVSKTDSSDTASVAGSLQIWLPMPGLLYSAKAKTASLANTVALVDALRGKRVVFDLTSTAWTIDTAAADAVVNCVTIIGGDDKTSEIFFYYAPKGTFLGFAISA